MANPTTNFGWVMPTSASLVTNLPADFNTFGQAVDTSMSELLGGTTGQVLSKTSNTNMDFTWVTLTDQTPLTTKGDLFAFSTVDARLPAGANETRLVADSAQTLGLKYVADTTNYAIAAKADLLVGTAADTLAALTVGTNGQVLTADSTVSPTGLKWATPASGSTFVGAGCMLGTSITTSNTTDTAITFSSELYDTDSIHSTSSNTSRFTVPTGKGGYWLVCFNATFAYVNTTGYRQIRLAKNGTITGSEPAPAMPANAGEETLGAAMVLSLSAGDYIEMYTWQNSGGNLNIRGTDSGNGRTFMSFNYLGA
jgi:hypothetical protein